MAKAGPRSSGTPFIVLYYLHNVLSLYIIGTIFTFTDLVVDVFHSLNNVAGTIEHEKLNQCCFNVEPLSATLTRP